MEFLTQLLDASKLAGWARAVVAGGVAVALAKWPGLASYLSPDAQAALGAVMASIVVGVWSTLAKSNTTSVAKLAENNPGVQTVILKDQATADSIPGNKVIGPEEIKPFATPTLAAEIRRVNKGV